MKCQEHPRYKGASRPRSNCLDCWKIYAKELERRWDRLDALRMEASDIVGKQYQQIRAEHVFEEGEPYCTLCGCFGPVEDDQPCVPRKDLVKRIKELEEAAKETRS